VNMANRPCVQASGAFVSGEFLTDMFNTISGLFVAVKTEKAQNS